MWAVKRRSDFYLALGLSVAVAALTLLPYLTAKSLAEPEGVFSGFLLNPWDGFSYLAKMRQGAGGSWLFRLAYTAEPGPGTLLFVFYLGLGRLASLLDLPLLGVYHGVRLLIAAGMFTLSYLLYDRLMADRRAKWAAFLLTLIGSGFGWLGMAFGLQASDLLIPESIPFLSAYTNPHFPLAISAFLGGMLAVLGGPGRLRLRTLGGVACGLVLGAVLPFVFITQALALGLWLLWEILQGGEVGQGWWEVQKSRIIPALGLAAGVLPWLIYDFQVSQTHPALKQWATQNLTPSPPILEYLFGFGLILVLGLAGAFLIKVWRKAEGRLMLVWVGVNAALLYFPFSLQRRLALGLFFPLAALAGMAIHRLSKKRMRPALLMVLVLVLSVPSNLVVIGAGLFGVQRGDPMQVLSTGEVEAYDWSEGNLPEGSLVLAAPESGNRLPAFANVRVLYGHPFETPGADHALELVESLYTWEGSAGQALQVLQAHGVDYVLHGSLERALGSPAWLGQLPILFQSDGISIYQVVSP
jgi:hypothetical protein